MSFLVLMKTFVHYLPRNGNIGNILRYILHRYRGSEHSQPMLYPRLPSWQASAGTAGMGSSNEIWGKSTSEGSKKFW
jgi:hypothetical protein